MRAAPATSHAADLASALICTRNRPESAAKAVGSLLADEDERHELVVIDQSDGFATEEALRQWRSDPRFVYHRSATRGKGVALNEGLKLTRNPILVCTDDDCEVPRGWATEMARTFEQMPETALVFCTVRPAPHDRSRGYVPSFEPPRPRLLRSVTAVRDGLGLGAAMAVRRDFLLSIGGFDESFGPGGRFPSADEWDLAIRTLLAGHHVFETTSLEIIHDGFRTFGEGKLHARRDWTALGAVCAKPLRAGHLSALAVPLWFFPSRALWPILVDLARLKRPRGLGRIHSFVKGFFSGLCTPVDRATMRFLK